MRNRTETTLTEVESIPEETVEADKTVTAGSSLGGVGGTTSLLPSLTLGCGAIEDRKSVV